MIIYYYNILLDDILLALMKIESSAIIKIHGVPTK